MFYQAQSKEQYEKTLAYLRRISQDSPQIGLILGSGLGALAEEIRPGVKISYGEIPNFPVSTVQGHQNTLVIGQLAGKTVLCMQGRFHFYEGYDMQSVVYPVRIMKLMGVRSLIVTNAAGGINSEFDPGDLMMIDDHINLMGWNPLIGQNEDAFGPRFPDMSEAYSKALRKTAQEAAQACKVTLQHGIYAALTGPSYETPAEICFLKTIGADAVGMSTVPEVIAANHCGMDVLGISCITNMAAGISAEALNHKEVIQTTKLANEKFVMLLKNIIQSI
jgi:purine-nucleoside phosphorylase